MNSGVKKRGFPRRLLSTFSIYKGLPSSIYVLFVAEVVNGIGIFVFPFLTLFLTKKLGMSEQSAGDFMSFLIWSPSLRSRTSPLLRHSRNSCGMKRLIVAATESA